MFDGVDEHGTQGPAIDIKFNLASDGQRRFYNLIRRIGFDLSWQENRPSYAVFDGRTNRGDHSPVTFYGSRGPPPGERPPPGPPAPPPGAAMPGYALNGLRRARDYARELFEPGPRFAYA